MNGINNMNEILNFRRARHDDLRELIAMLADDTLGAKREKYADPLPESYYLAFNAIEADPNNELIVALRGEEIAGMMQLTFIPYLTYQGSWRAQVEGVRIKKAYRGSGFGTQMFEWAIQRARERGCHMLQLTTDKSRPDALKFYESLGFTASHEGMKLHL